jgi:hypothetical protein
VRGFFELGLEHLQHAFEVFEYLVVPDPDDLVPERSQNCVPLGICCAVGMLAAVDLDDQMPLAADKVGVVGSYRLLAYEFDAAELAVAQLSP